MPAAQISAWAYYNIFPEWSAAGGRNSNMKEIWAHTHMLNIYGSHVESAY